MKVGQYELTSDERFTTFEFVSEGPKGRIEKLVRFESVSDGYYNLAFGDKNLITGDLNDKVVTNNGDSEKVLATVAAAIYLFCDKVPDAWIYATGSTAARTRLYKMGVNRYYHIAKEDFFLYGLTQEKIEPYEKDKMYDAFVVRRRKT